MLNEKGFTLVELMIVVAIVGILAGIAYPSYQSSVMKSRRVDAQGALLGFANAMERHFTEGNTYLGAAGTDGAPADTGAPRIYSATSPVGGGTAYYDLAINDGVTANSYTLSATPTGAQANDPCGTLTLTQTGVKGIDDANEGFSADDCW
jgi:type IV pilus assembly protein PilE